MVKATRKVASFVSRSVQQYKENKAVYALFVVKTGWCKNCALARTYSTKFDVASKR